MGASLHIQEGVGLPLCDVADNGEEELDIDAFPHVEAVILGREEYRNGGVADSAVGNDDHPLAWSDLLVQSVMNEY